MQTQGQQSIWEYVFLIDPTVESINNYQGKKRESIFLVIVKSKLMIQMKACRKTNKNS